MVWIIIIILAGADQFTKWLITQNIGSGESIPVIPSFFYLVNRQNTGAAWSLLANQEWGIVFLSILSAVVTVVLLIVLFRTPYKSLKICLAVLSAGSIGNLIDRVFRGSVTDFLDFRFGSYTFPTFNLADMLIVCSTIFLCLLLFRNHHIVDHPFRLPVNSSIDENATQTHSDGKNPVTGKTNEGIHDETS